MSASASAEVVGQRQRGSREEFRHAMLDENAGADVADHRIAAIERGGIFLLHALDGAQDGLARLGRADIAGDEPVAGAEHAALGDARHAIVDHLRVERPAAKRAIARMIGELHGVNGPDFDAHALQGEDRGGIADMAIGDVRLDGENVHCAHNVIPEDCASNRTGIQKSA